jgi:hypothetical protein
MAATKRTTTTKKKMTRSEAGRLGAAAQPLEAKRRGGKNSHKNR